MANIENQNIEEQIEKLRAAMITSGLKKGFTHLCTVALSQALDKLLNKQMKGETDMSTLAEREKHWQDYTEESKLKTLEDWEYQRRRLKQNIKQARTWQQRRFLEQRLQDLEETIKQLRNELK